MSMQRMRSPMPSEILDRALNEWAKGDYYEAHELLEDFAETVEDDDADHEIAIALIHVAASLHKAVNDVGRKAVPGKLEHALTVLDRAPADWQGLALAEQIGRASCRERGW